MIKKSILFFANGLFAVFKRMGIDLPNLIFDFLLRRKMRCAYPRGKTLRDDGLTLCAQFDWILSLPQVGRDFINAMKETSIPFDAYNLRMPFSSAPALPECEMAPIRAVCKQQASFKRFILFATWPHPRDPRFSNGLTPFWEFDNGMLEAFPSLFDHVQHVIAFTDFLQRFFTTVLPTSIQVHKVRYPFRFFESPKTTTEETRASLQIPPDAFIAFFHFSYGSCYERKNPEGVLHAFCGAGLREKPNAWVVIKTSGSQSYPDKVRELSDCAESLGLKRVLFINESTSRQRILELIQAADVYISLHHGEGFGLGMLEAMSVGTPVIATDYGGNTDFTTPKTAFMVDYTMRPAHMPGFPVYRFVKEWAEPNIETAAGYLKALYEDPQLGKEKAAAATAFIHDYFSIANFEADVRRMMSEWKV